jgi:septal ring factor EnvC (AmiA/AmiB activator)
MLRISAPPRAGKAGRLAAILDPNRSCTVRLSRLQRGRNKMSIYDQIQELRAELANCVMSRRERASAKAELTRLIAEQAKLDRELDDALAEAEPPG